MRVLSFFFYLYGHRQKNNQPLEKSKYTRQIGFIQGIFVINKLNLYQSLLFLITITTPKPLKKKKMEFPMLYC